MKNLLSIGDVAKLRNINVQSLRYYEKIGVLTPAYINPDSGYRYYSMDQLMILDTIILCIELGIPLKDLDRYVDNDGKLKFEKLLKDGRKLAVDKIDAIKQGLNSIDRTLQHINAQKEFMGRSGYYTRFIFKRQYVSIPCQLRMDAKTYEKNFNKLLTICKKNNIQALFQHGIIIKYSKGCPLSTSMFLEVLACECPTVETIPEGNYLCLQEKREDHSNPEAVFPPKIFEENDVNVIISCMSPDTYKYDEVILEFQVTST